MSDLPTTTPSPSPASGIAGAISGWLHRHPDLAAVALILLVALPPRVLILSGAPVFIMKDSASYFLPGWDLAHGLDFDLELRRTPLYPLFVALVLRLFGDDLLPLAIVQHVLGAATAVCTYVMGRLAFDRLVGLGAGLLAALAGPLLVFGHYVMPEALFTCLMVAGVTALLAGIRGGRLAWYATAGLLLGGAALTRPAAQLVLVALPVVLLLVHRSWRRVVVPTGVASIALAAVVAPWMAVVYAEYGVVSTGATLGEPLIFRTIHQDRGFKLPDRTRNPYPDQVRNDARRMVVTMAARRENPSAIVHRLRRDLKLSRPAADAALRDVALEMIAEQPGHYLLSTARLTGVLFVGRYESLNLSWTNRRDRAGEDTLENWQSVDRIRHLIQPATPRQRDAYDEVDLLIRLVQPQPWAIPIAGFFLVGILAALARPPWRPGLLLALSAVALLLTCTLFSGAVPRFRYPADPFIHTVALAGVAASVRALRPIASRLARLGARGEPLPAPRPRPTYSAE